MKYTRVYNIYDLKELKASERKLNKLLNKHKYVRVINLGQDKIQIAYM
jgi:hypothetical protein